MKDKDVIDVFLRLEARVTQLETHFHEFDDTFGKFGFRTEYGKKTSNPKVRGSPQTAKRME